MYTTRIMYIFLEIYIKKKSPRVLKLPEKYSTTYVEETQRNRKN